MKTIVINESLVKQTLGRVYVGEMYRTQHTHPPLLLLLRVSLCIYKYILRFGCKSHVNGSGRFVAGPQTGAYMCSGLLYAFRLLLLRSNVLVC